MSELLQSDTNFLETRLQRAYQRVSDHWIPTNPKLVKKVKDGLDEGVYDLDIEFLITELKTDIGLLTYCLKELMCSMKKEGHQLSQTLSPITLLREAGVDRIQSIIERIEQRAETHNLGAASNLQSAGLREAMISSSAAEVLSEGKDIEADLGFSVAMMRQLGFLLVSWNYPTVYSRAVEQVDEDHSLEHALNEALGFSPQILASYVVGEWGLSTQIQQLVSGDAHRTSDGNEIVPEDDGTLYTLKTICEVGEALARADNPELYPTAEHDWEMSRNAIESILGPQGLRTVQDQVRKNCEGYRTSLPSMFADTEQFNPATRIVAFREDSLLKSNPYVKACSPYLKKAFKDLYAHMNRTTISQHSVRTLAHEIIPAAGFSGGCVYIYDPSQKGFIPRLKIGTLELRSFAPVPLNSQTREQDSIVIAFNCQTPMVEHSRKGTAVDTASIAAVLGEKRKMGVIYLELPQVSLNEVEQNSLLHFKAIRRALEDALQLSE